MRASNIKAIRNGTAPDLIEAARRGGWVAARLALAAGLDGEAVRTRVVGRFRDRFDHGDEYERETLIAEIQRGVDAALATSSARGPDPGRRSGPAQPGRTSPDCAVIP
jgi:hypothetical protein